MGIQINGQTDTITAVDGSFTLGEDFTKEEFYSEFGQGSTFPQVICDEKKLGGSVDTIKFLKEQQIV